MNQRGGSLGARLRSVDRLGMSKPPTSFPPCFLNWSTGVVVSAPKPGFKLVVDLGGGCHSNPMCEQCVPFDGRLESPSCLMLSEDQANVDPLRAGLQHCELLASSKTHVSPLLRMFDDASNSQCCRSEEHTSELQSR